VRDEAVTPGGTGAGGLFGEDGSLSQRGSETSDFLDSAQAIEQIMRGEYPVSPALARHLFRLAGSNLAPCSSGGVKLSPRELELLQWLSKGESYASCAGKMGISFSTVQTHIRNMYRKLEVSNQRQAINKAQSSGLLHP
jgi:DNA-binding NarL/FixJ family response regulator